MRKLSVDQARRLAIRAQHLDRRHPKTRRSDVAALVANMGVLQIDTVNVLARAHYLPLYSRLGPYDQALLHKATSESPRLIVEQWGHEACFVPPITHRLLAGFGRRWSSGEAIENHPVTPLLTERILGFLDGNPSTSQEVNAWIQTQDLTPAEAELATSSTQFTWSRNAIKVILEYLFGTDVLASAGRTHHFHRIYGLREQVLPPSVATMRAADRATALRELTDISLHKVGIGTPATVADFFRLNQRDVRPILHDLVSEGRAEWVEVPGMKDAIMPTSIPIPRSVAGTTFLSPFDPLIFERKRAEALFGLEYRIGIYTPAAKRTKGYYSLPLLHNGTIPLRADLALDRPTSTLLIKGAWYEPGYENTDTDKALTKELARLASWLGATAIRVVDEAPGDAIPALTRAL